MAPLLDFDALAFVKHRAHIVPLAGDACERLEAVDAGDGRGTLLQRLELGADEAHQLVVDALFEHEHLLLGTQNLLLVFLELLGDVTLGVGQRLLADPRVGHLVLVGIADLDVITEDIVVAQLERRDAGRLALALLDAQQVVLAVEGDAAQVVELGVDPSAMTPPFCIWLFCGSG